jgi:cytochrome P450
MTRDRPAHVPDHLVHDFMTRFEGPLEDVFSRFDALHALGPVFWSDDVLGRGDEPLGAWVITRQADIRTVLQTPDSFSSISKALAGAPPMIPIFMDPPEHTDYRRLLNPLFTPSVAARMADEIRQRAVELVDSVASQGGCDFVTDVAVHFPTRIFTTWFGLPEAATTQLVAMVNAIIHGTAAENMDAMGAAAGVLFGHIAARKEHPTDDLMSQIIQLDHGGQPLTDDELFRIAFLLFLAGLDTVVAALSLSYWHLAQSPEDRRALVSGQVDAAHAVEELLRRNSFVNLTRDVRHDLELAGVQMRKGDTVLASLVLAGRDPLAYPDPTDVQLERLDVRHYAFGGGPHRCAGSHLARLEMKIFFEEWHARIPDYELAGPAIGYSGTVMGAKHLPLRWG